MVSEKARVKTSSRRPERAPATAAAFRRTWTSGSKISSKMRCGLSRRLRSLNPRMSIIATATLPRTLFCPLRRRRPAPVPRACLLAWWLGTRVLRSNRPTSFSRNDSNSNGRSPLASGRGDGDRRADDAADPWWVGVLPCTSAEEKRVRRLARAHLGAKPAARRRTVRPAVPCRMRARPQITGPRLNEDQRRAPSASERTDHGGYDRERGWTLGEGVLRRRARDRV